ncbi:MAG: hypothetical protein ABWY05_04370 [Noviherbaspirillum sp.]
MGKSGMFDTDTGELAPHAGEFLAGVLALSRISRVTVALESGHDAGAALLAAARVTGHAETCLLFDRWSGDPLEALSAALRQTDRDGDFPPGASLAQGLHAMQTRGQQSFLIIFDRFEQYLEQDPDPVRDAAFDRAFVELATNSELDVHLLLVLDEAAEQMLGRFQDEIPGIGDGCLRMPAGALLDSQAGAPAQQGSHAARRDRSFGMLLERLTARAPVDEGPAEQDQPRQELPAAAAAPFRDETPVQEAQPEPVQDPVPAPLRDPVPEPVRDPVPDPVPPVVAPDAPAAAPPVSAEPPLLQSSPEAPPRRPRKALTAALVALVAVGVAVFAYRQQAPRAAPPVTPAPATAASSANPAPAVTPPQQQPTSPAPPLASAPALATVEPRPEPPVPAAPPAAAAAAAAAPARSMPTVHVHVRSQRERDRLQAISRTLAAKGIRVVDVKVMSTGPSVADLRYFRDEDREQALTVQKALVAAGVPVPRLSRMNGFENTTRPHQFEVWLSGESRPASSRR